MRRESILAYLWSDLDREMIVDAADDLRMVAEVRDGGLEQASEDAKSWNVVPDYLVVDVSRVQDVGRALKALQATAPQGVTHVIFVGSRNDIALYKELRDLGGADYLTSPLARDEVTRVVRFILAERRKHGKAVNGERVVAVVGARPGCGASMIASVLTEAMSLQHGRRTLLIELDCQYGIQHLTYDAKPTDNLVEMLSNPKRIDFTAMDRSIYRPGGKGPLALLSAASGATLGVIEPKAVEELVIQAHQGIERVVLDISLRGPVDPLVAKMASLVYLVAPKTIPGFRDAINFISGLDKAGFSGDLVLVLNRSAEAKIGQVAAEMFSKRLPRTPKIIEVPFDPMAVMTAFSEKRSPINSKGRFGRSMKDLVQTLPTAPAPQLSLLDRILGPKK